VYCLYHHQNVSGPFLVVAPLSTLQHWYREFSSWTDLNAVVYAGVMEDRRVIRDYEFYFPPENDVLSGQPAAGKGKGNKGRTKFQVG